MERVCVFDVNETLLDLRALDAHFARIFGDAGVRQAWFAQLIQSALVATVTDVYSDFATIGGAALDMLAARQDITLSSADRAQSLRRASVHGDRGADRARRRRRRRQAGCARSHQKA